MQIRRIKESRSGSCLDTFYIKKRKKEREREKKEIYPFPYAWKRATTTPQRRARARAHNHDSATIPPGRCVHVRGARGASARTHSRVSYGPRGKPRRTACRGEPGRGNDRCPANLERQRARGTCVRTLYILASVHTSTRSRKKPEEEEEERERKGDKVMGG